MDKKTFLNKLSSELTHLSKSERDDIINYYDELIEDKMDREGLSEEEIIAELGSIDEIVKRVAPKSTDTKIHYDEVEETCEKANNNEKVKIIIFTILGIFGLIIAISLLISAFASLITLVSTGIGLLVTGIVALGVDYLSALFEIGSGLMLIGLSVMVIPLIIKGLKALIKWLIPLIKKHFNKLKEVF